jgi:subtilisin family serine protease
MGRFAQGLVLLLASLLAAGCGGGGAAVRAPVTNIQPPPPPPPPSLPPTDPGPVPGADAFRTAEYERSRVLDAINAADAYALGFTGEGVIIGFVDFNFVLNSPEVDYHPLSVDVNSSFEAIYEAQIGRAVSPDEHGHAVAAMAAGVKNNSEIHGVAFDAQVLAVDFFSGVNLTTQQQGGTLVNISNPWTYLMARGVRVVSKSFGFDEGDIISNPPQVSQRYTIETEAHVVDRGGLLVVSAGNNSDPDPSLSNLQLISILTDNNLLDSGPGAFIFVGAVDQNNQIASFSDRGGRAREFFMVAPGVDLVFPWNGGLAVGSGTSFSAPIVAGAAAVILERWPTLTAREVREILFITATDLGAAGLDPIYGHGLLNLRAALQPLGQSTLAIEGSGLAPPVTSTGMVLGPGFGDAAGLRPGLQNIMMLDGFARDFAIDLTGLISNGRTRAALSDILDARRDWRVSSLTLGATAALNFAVGEDLRHTESLAYLGQAARDLEPKRELLLEFAGRLGAFDLKAGTGARLAEAIADRPLAPYTEPLLSLSQAFSNRLESAAGSYASAGLWLDQQTRLRFGAAIAEAYGVRFHPLEELRRSASVHLAAVRLDRYRGRGRLGAEMGAMSEQGAILGSRSAGGLALTQGAYTTWLKIDADQMIGRRLSLAFTATGALSQPGSVSGSLFGSIGTIASSSFALRLAGQGMIKHGDAFSLTLNQPLRVERAPVTLVSGIGREPDTGNVMFAAQGLSLTPSGREIGLEGAYRAAIGEWLAEANLAYRFDADHVAGRRELAVLFNVSRLF